ncbi:MAG: DegQ family serine endoprotease [Deltaproteobacteria bacterium]|nr:DegQ family serine endoprotease [Deltaproteobacteria bacterium]
MISRKYGLRTLIMVAAISLFTGLWLTAGPGVTGNSDSQNFWKDAPDAKGKKEKGQLENGAPQSFSSLAKKLTPSVVNISTTQEIKRRRVPFPEFRTQPFEEFFDEEEMDKLFGGDGSFKRQSLGSGFIINKDGYIVTNYHVIENAAEIVVTLSNDSKKEYTAKVIGRDQSLDLALIKIDATEELPVVALGDSDSLDIGDWVVAIGNPFGLGGTVTAGIVSQKGRVIDAGPYDDFIQTDASINPGNSGGPLFNLRGEVVGINTAIVMGGQGIGFAIPVNLAKGVLLQLKEKGKATRGWIGVSLQDITPDLATSFGLSKPYGALVPYVLPGDPADKAGMKSGDVIVAFDGKEVSSTKDLRSIVAATVPGSTVDVKVVRDGKERALKITVATKKDTAEEEGKGRETTEDEDEKSGKRLGIGVTDITKSIAERFRLDSTDGVLIASVKQDGLGAEAGLRRGDIIREMNGKAVKDVAEFNKILKAVKKGILRLRIKRGEGFMFVTIKLKD